MTVATHADLARSSVTAPPALLRPRAGLANCLCCHREYIALLLDDGICLCGPPPTLTPECMLRVEAPEVIACAADGSLLGVATRMELRFYAILKSDAGGLTARLRGRVQLQHCQPRGLDIASLVPGAAPASAHGVGAIVGAAGLTIARMAGDDGEDEPTTVAHHRGTAIGACRFSDDGILLALAAIDGRLLVRKRPDHGGGNAEWAAGLSTLIWCARCPCERVLSLDFTMGGRYIACAGWRGDVAVYDCAGFPMAAEAENVAAPAPSADITIACAPSEEWRLVWHLPPPSSSSLSSANDEGSSGVGGAGSALPSPMTLVWCRSPAHEGYLCIARPVTAATTTDTLRLWVGPVGIGGGGGGGGGGGAMLPGTSPIRGLCSCRVAQENEDVEMVICLDASGQLSTQTLWSWVSVDDAEDGRRRLLAERPPLRLSRSKSDEMLRPSS